jgi:hippurate hydrolase
MGILTEIVEGHGQMKLWRQDIHAHPELGFEETRTADLVARQLESFGIEVHRGVGRTGVVGVLRQGSSPRSVGLRADMDALPVEEATPSPTARATPGACTPAATTATPRCCSARPAIWPPRAASTAP